MPIRLSGDSYKKSKGTEGTGQNKREDTDAANLEATSLGSAARW